MPTSEVIAELAPTGTLRAGINLGNFLLVTGTAENGDPEGVSPDMAREIARRLGVDVAFVCFDTPSAVADAVSDDVWDIGNIADEPQRAEHIAFSAAYCEIEATYLVRSGSAFANVSDVDQPGTRIATMGRAAFSLWLENNLKHAELVQTDGMDSALAAFVDQDLEALAGLRTRLMKDADTLPGARVLDGKFSAVQQAMGTPKRNVKAAAWLAEVVEELKASGFVADAIARHGAKGLSVAPAAA